MKSGFFYCSISIIVLVCGRELSMTKRDGIDSDLHKYLKCLNKVEDFFLAHKHYVDIIVYIGTFFANVNLIRALRDKGDRLPTATRVELEQLVRKNYKIKSYFDQEMKKRYITVDGRLYHNLTTLFDDHTLPMWIDRIKEFHDVIGERREPFLSNDWNYMTNRYTSWNEYLDATNASLEEVGKSDFCLLSVATHPINYSNKEDKCDIHEFCRQFVRTGADSGYLLTHRLLILFVAHNGRGCYVISPEEDRRLRKKFCADMYSESLFIEKNNYKYMDLFMEQILFCTFDGHAEFVKHHWLMEPLSLQTKEGCFPESRDNREGLKLGEKRKRLAHRYRGWHINNVKRDNLGKFLMLGGRCNGHTTTLVAGVLTSAVRFLLEKFY